MQALAPVVITGSVQQVQILAKPVTPQPTPIRFANESPYALQIQMAGKTFWLQPWTVDVFTPDLHVIDYTIRPTILSPLLAPAPSYQLLVTIAAPGESFGGTYPFNLDRQTAAYSQQILLDTINIVSDNQLVLHSGIVVPPGTHAIGIVSNIPTTITGGISYVQVYGNVSNSFYFNLVNPTSNNFLSPLYTPILSGLDTQLGFQVQALNPAPSKPFSVYLVALLDPLAVAALIQNPFLNAQLVDANNSALFTTFNPSFGPNLGIAQAPPDVTAFSSPGSGVQASAALAGVANKRILVTSVTFSAINNNAAAGAAFQSRVWDGTSAGTKKANFVWAIPAGFQSQAPITLPYGCVFGSVGNAVTADFDVAPPANYFQSVHLAGRYLP